MSAVCSLQSLFQKQIGESSSDFDRTVCLYLKSPQQLPDDFLEECLWQETLLSEDRAIENWKQLLATNLLCQLAQTHPHEIGAKIRLFEHHPWNQSSQYFRALVAINHALAKMPIPEVGVHLLESGSALLDLQEYSPWLSLPYHPHHFEFGLFLALLALITKRQDLQDVVLRLAHWQLNTLDASGKPFKALFVREREGKNMAHLSVCYLFFRAASLLSDDNPFAAIAQNLSLEIDALGGHKKGQIHPVWPLIEKWLEEHARQLAHSSPPVSLLLSEQIHDPSNALVGYRSPSQHVVCTLHGGHTGLGGMKLGDVEIINYGPQYLPLGECQGFGIEGNALSDHGMRRSTIEWRRHSFCLKGCTRLVDQPSPSPLEGGKFRGIWLDVTQEFKKPDLYLKTTFLGLNGWEAVAFSFFVTALRCRTASQHYLHPGKLDRYEGSVQTLTFEGQESTLELRSLSPKGNMEVIPLAGGNNFWGADFLVAYLMTSDQRHYQWHLGPPHTER